MRAIAWVRERWLDVTIVAGGFLLGLLLTGGISQLMAQQIPGPVPPSGPVSALGTVLIGLGATAATGILRAGTGWVDERLGTVDRSITRTIGPAVPIVTTVLAAALPWLSNQIGLTAIPDAALLVNAPASAVVGIAARELLVRLIPSLKPAR